jgi:hypothetical protein
LFSDFIVGELGLYANDTNDVNIISRAIKLRGELQADNIRILIKISVAVYHTTEL